MRKEIKIPTRQVKLIKQSRYFSVLLIVIVSLFVASCVFLLLNRHYERFMITPF